MLKKPPAHLRFWPAWMPGARRGVGGAAFGGGTISPGRGLWEIADIVDVLEAWENCSMMWRTDATDCAYDLFSFMEEQIEVAKSNPADQLAAIDAASGAIPIVEKKCRKPTRRYPSF
jgi:hypothetical protein